MGNAQWMLELVLLLLLAATLFHALRLERALGVLKRDRAVLEELVVGFNDSTRQAETGIERLRAAADGAGRQMARQIDNASHLRDDLNFLVERSERLASRLEGAVRSARMVADTAALPQGATAASNVVGMQTAAADIGEPVGRHRSGAADTATLADNDEQPRLRSQAERDLLRALRGGR